MDTLETIFEHSWHPTRYVRNKVEEPSHALGAFINSQQYHVSELGASYQSKMQIIKELKFQIKKNK